MVLIKADTFECPDTHTEKFTNQKVYFLGLSPEKSTARNWNNLLAYKFSLTVSPKLFISVIENVSNVAKLTKSNSFDQKMNLASLPVGGSQEKEGKQTKRFNKWSREERERWKGQRERGVGQGAEGRKEPAPSTRHDPGPLRSQGCGPHATRHLGPQAEEQPRW